MKIKELKARVEAAVAMFRAEGLNVVIGLSETGGAWTVAHVCDPSFGGCNQGFELTRHTQVA